MACGRHESEVGEITWRGNCLGCAMERYEQSVQEQQERRGPMYRRWRARLLTSLGGVALDDLAALVQDDADAR